MDVQQHFSSREEETLLQECNGKFFSYTLTSGCGAGGDIITPALTGPLQVVLSTDEGNGQGGSANGTEVKQIGLKWTRSIRGRL